MNINLSAGNIDIVVIKHQIGIFSDPFYESYFGKYCEDFGKGQKYDIWFESIKPNIIYNNWIKSIRRRN